MHVYENQLASRGYDTTFAIAAMTSVELQELITVTEMKPGHAAVLRTGHETMQSLNQVTA